jgi:outer membrane lipoprotein SlyB
VLSACSTTSPDVVQRGDAQRLSQVQDATVLSSARHRGRLAERRRRRGRRRDRRHRRQLGRRPPRRPGGRRAGRRGGCRHRQRHRALGHPEDALEIIVQLRNGDRRSVVQAKGNETFNSGDPVILVTTGGKTRVTRPGRHAGGSSNG